MSEFNKRDIERKLYNLGLNQKKFSEILNISQAYLSDILNGKTCDRTFMKEKILKTLDELENKKLNKTTSQN